MVSLTGKERNIIGRELGTNESRQALKIIIRRGSIVPATTGPEWIDGSFRGFFNTHFMRPSLAITCPGFSIHGGIRIILEWANRLNEYYQVSILNTGKNTNHKRPTWFKISKDIPIYELRDSVHPARHADILIISSPHGMPLEKIRNGKKTFLFLQMMEHLFRDGDAKWLETCKEFYTSDRPMILISTWNFQECVKMGRKAPTFYVGNGVNLQDFPIEHTPKSGKIVLVEGWECYNTAKDVQNIGPIVANRLKREGYIIWAYSQFPLKTFPKVPDNYIYCPTLEQLNSMYKHATILLKASKYDARALAPLEAMTKGTVTARAIVQGDDDLIDGVNALVCGYEEEALYQNAKRLLGNEQPRKDLSNNCIDYVQEFSWAFYMKTIVNILEGNEKLMRLN